MENKKLTPLIDNYFYKKKVELEIKLGRFLSDKECVELRESCAKYISHLQTIKESQSRYFKKNGVV